MTLAGIVKVIIPVLLNALSPIVNNCELSISSNVTVVKFVAALNALFPILVTLAGIVISVNIVAPWNALYPIVFNEQSPSGVFSNITSVKFVAPLNALFPILVTDLLTVTFFNFVIAPITSVYCQLSIILGTLLIRTKCSVSLISIKME